MDNNQDPPIPFFLNSPFDEVVWMVLRKEEMRPYRLTLAIISDPGNDDDTEAVACG